MAATGHCEPILFREEQSSRLHCAALQAEAAELQQRLKALEDRNMQALKDRDAREQSELKQRARTQALRASAARLRALLEEAQARVGQLTAEKDDLQTTVDQKRSEALLEQGRCKASHIAASALDRCIALAERNQRDLNVLCDKGQIGIDAGSLAVAAH